MLMMDMMVYMSDSQCNQILDSMSLGLMIRSFSACDAWSIQLTAAKVFSNTEGEWSARARTAEIFIIFKSSAPALTGLNLWTLDIFHIQ